MTPSAMTYTIGGHIVRIQRFILAGLPCQKEVITRRHINKKTQCCTSVHYRVRIEDLMQPGQYTINSQLCRIATSHRSLSSLAEHLQLGD